MSVILLNREIVHYEVLGRGRPVILLHGWVGSWRYWVPVMQAASFSYRAYALDFWGFGDSSKNPDLYPIDEQIRLLDGFMNEMGIARVALIGHGLGALVALYYARQHPDLVDRVMAIAYPLVEKQVSTRLRTQSPAALADWLCSKTPATEPVRTDAGKTDPLAVLASLNGENQDAFTHLQGCTETACLLVHGQNDPVVPAPALEQYSELPERVHGITFDESGHFPMLDESSKFNRLMIDFLALQSGESPRDLQLKEEWKRRVR
jgi:pimeloyl-ACP methyl ester carboxylesterase